MKCSLIANSTMNFKKIADKREFVEICKIWSQEQHIQNPPLPPLVLNFLWGFCPSNFLFLWITHWGMIFGENVKRTKLFGLKFSIRTLLTRRPKPHIEAGNFPLRVKKLLFCYLKLLFLMYLSCQDYIFGENVKRKKLFPIKFSIMTLFTI